tara:strand:- start:1151 stop:1345 length:195 start_codon:yes stop_codon:yes gene_type:complete
MIKQIKVTLLVEVDTEDKFICPSGDPLLENCVVNTVEDGFFTDPVKVLSVKDLGDLRDSEDSQA